jgi:hypothetical protein
MKWAALCAAAATLIVGCAKKDDPVAQAEKQDVAKGIAAPGIAETKAIAEEGFIYGLPLVMNYAVMNEFSVNKDSGQFKGPFNQIINEARVFTYKDTAVVTPNSDTPYSLLWLDLRTEPYVLSVPAIPKARYYSVQLCDGNTFNYGYIGTRATGTDAGDYLVVGPDWKGATPAGIKKVFQSSTQFSIAIYRTQLLNPSDMPNVVKVQAGYKVQPLSAYLKQPAPPAASTIDFPKIDKEMVKTNFFDYLDFALQFAPAGPEETAIRAKLATIGIGPGKTFAFKDLSVEHKAAILLGMKEGETKVDKAVANLGKNINGWRVSAAQGDRAFYNGNWLLRAAAAKAGIYGNDPVEAAYPLTKALPNGDPIDTGKHNYTITFPGQCVLVDHDVRRQEPATDRESDQSLSDQLAHAAPDEEKSGWLTDDLRPEGFAGYAKGVQLAAGTERHGLSGNASVLAKGIAAVNTAAWGRNVATAGHRGGEIAARGGRSNP